MLSDDYISPIRKFNIQLLALLCLTIAPAWAETCSIKFDNGTELQVPYTTNLDRQQKGLSGRKDVGAGLLMVFEKPAVRGVWMKDTPVALDAAFIAMNGGINSIQAMQPNTTTSHYAFTPSVAILETPATWLKRQNITVKNKIISSSCFSITAQQP